MIQLSMICEQFIMACEQCIMAFLQRTVFGIVAVPQRDKVSLQALMVSSQVSVFML